MGVFEKYNCILCGCEAGHQNDLSRHAHYYDCPCCGVFWVDSTLHDEWVANINMPGEMIQRQQLAAVVIERKFQGFPPPFIADTDKEYPFYRNSEKKEGYLGIVMGLKRLISFYPKNGIELFDRILINISSAPWVGNPMTAISLPDYASLLSLFATGVDRNEVLQNATAILREMARRNYIDIISPRELPDALNAGVGLKEQIKICISTEGWRRLQELQEVAPGNTRQAFVAMWFDSSRDKYYEGIKTAIENAHLPEYAVECIRIDHTQHNDKICSRITSTIRQCCYVVADVTGNNGGAYYEAGYAQGLGKPVIWVMDNQYFKEHPMHFDVRQYNTVLYNSPEELKDKLETRIQATISYHSIAIALTSVH